MQKESSLKQALSSLPHGEGFRFIDELTALQPGVSASGWYLIKGSESFLKAHFPGDPMMPGVILIEALAQMAGIAVQNDSPSSSHFTNMRLAAVRQAKILAAARPGDRLLIEANVTAQMGGLFQAQGNISIAGVEEGDSIPVLKAQITLSVAS